MQINKDGLETNKIILASTATIDRFDKVYILLNSIKKTKQPETKIEYWLFAKGEEMSYAMKYLQPITDADFTIVFHNINELAPAVHTPARNHIYFAKCLFPNLFIQYDKIIYLDIDMVFINNGIEDLWNTDISDYYIGACIDVAWQYCPVYWQDIPNTKTKNYFNAGMILFNLDRIRKEGKANELQRWCLHWNLEELKCICYDQTLLNYILKDKVKILNFKYNNTLLSSDRACKISYKDYLNTLGYEKATDSLNDAVILHFSGENKPWSNILSCNYVYKERAESIWKTLLEKYKKG